MPIVLTALLLLWPAVYNGAPLIFSDTLDFPTMMLEPAARQLRSRGYGIVAGLPALAFHSFWPIVLVQAALTAWLIHAVLRATLPALTRAGHLAAGAAIALLTTAPWEASYVMPDALTAPGVLAMFLLLVGSGPIRAAAAAVVVLAAATHVTHGLILLCALAAAALLRLVHWRRAAVGVVCIALGYGAVLAANRALTGHAEFVRGGEAFLAARFAGDGLLDRHLSLACPDPRLPLLCAGREALPRDADDFLWRGDSPLRPDGDFFAAAAEFRLVNAAIIAAYWKDWAAASLLRAAHQLVSVRAGDGLEQELMREFIPRIAPIMGEAAAETHIASRQYTSDLETSWLGWVAYPSGLAALVLAPILLIRCEDRRIRLLLTLLLAACLANALAVGFGGSVHARYTARLVWALVLAVGVAVAARRFAQR